jgi:tRNA 2-thiouridine synthesizing protein A
MKFLFSDIVHTDNEQSAQWKANRMSVVVLDTLGVKCPQPVLKIAVKAPSMRPGDILEVLGDCPTFERDIRAWCQRMGKVMLSVKEDGETAKKIQIQF